MTKRLRQDSAASAPGAAVLGQSSDAHPPKYASVERELPVTHPLSAMRCSLPPHTPLDFSSPEEYELHYQQAHTNRCAECKRNLPTNHFLDLHIAENHDPILASKREAGQKTYACFVDGCEKVCQDWKKRRSHLVDKHAFPKNYDFLVVDHGIDGRRSMLRPGIDAQGHRRSSRERRRSNSSLSDTTQTAEANSVSERETDPPALKVAAANIQQGESNGSGEGASKDDADAVDELASSLSALKMVPRSITFGKRKGRSGFAKS